MRTLIFGLILFISPALFADPQARSLVRERITKEGELAPLPEVMNLLNEVAGIIDSEDERAQISRSPHAKTINLIREHLRTSLYHLNLKFQVDSTDYPYDPPFNAPFPFRPTLEAVDESIRYLSLVEQVLGSKSETLKKLETLPYFEDLKALFPPAKLQGRVRAFTKKEMVEQPVDTYEAMQRRLSEYGELASFPEFEEAVSAHLMELKSADYRKLKEIDPAFGATLDHALAELSLVSKKEGPASALHPAFVAPYPYRRTLQALELASNVFDMKERIKFPLVTNWHEVEASWYIGNKPKVLNLYHFNRYKYQMFGLLADPEVVIFPWFGPATEEDIIRMSAAPIGILGENHKTGRADRHMNTPLDFKYHDVNHFRRMWGYMKRKLAKLGATTREQKLAVYREQQRFIENLVGQLGHSDDRIENEMRKLEMILIFETDHETARTMDRDSLLYDLSRTPGTRQPFEVNVQAKLDNLEDIRTFDGNLRSGADNNFLNLTVPTTVKYFWDRAPGYLANVDNKLRWGFYDSVFDMDSKLVDPKFRIPRALAEAAQRLYRRLGANPPAIEKMVKEIVDRSGQPELWAYYGMRDIGLINLSGIDSLAVIAARDIHDNWRRTTPRKDRWLPTDAKLADGSLVNDQQKLARYLSENKMPAYLHKYYRLEFDSTRGQPILWEDIRNLPFEYMASNHRTENVMSGAKAVSLVDRIWQKDVEFKSLDQVERWMTMGAAMIHKAVLERNANGVRNNPIYNQHWMKLPAVNQMHDLDLVRLAFEARVKLDPTAISTDQLFFIREGILQLQRKIEHGEKGLRSCEASLSVERDTLIDQGKTAPK